jgi:hypothetical protein
MGHLTARCNHEPHRRSRVEIKNGTQATLTAFLTAAAINLKRLAASNVITALPAEA